MDGIDHLLLQEIEDISEGKYECTIDEHFRIEFEDVKDSLFIQA